MSEPRPRPRKNRRPSSRSTRPPHRSVAEVVRDRRDWEAIRNHQPMEMTTEPTIMGRIGDEVGSDHPAPLIRPLT
jgi:hypothetical protein